MKQPFIVVLLLLLFPLTINAQSTIGLGLGNRGIVIKSFPSSTFRYSLRIEPDIEFFFGFNADLDLGINLVREEKATLYMTLGGGIQSYDVDFDAAEFYFFKIPLGIEFFPFERKNLSVAAEAFPIANMNWFQFEVDSIRMEGLVEITYYF
ncbi:MAG: hypothetical protein HRU41_21725 [Saprospiraceae bacterium]|nr:hypothetical protein [Saprospiraceae bacterium]